MGARADRRVLCSTARESRCPSPGRSTLLHRERSMTMFFGTFESRAFERNCLAAVPYQEALGKVRKSKEVMTLKRSICRSKHLGESVGNAPSAQFRSLPVPAQDGRVYCNADWCDSRCSVARLLSDLASQYCQCDDDSDDDPRKRKRGAGAQQVHCATVNHTERPRGRELDCYQKPAKSTRPGARPCRYCSSRWCSSKRRASHAPTNSRCATCRATQS